MTDLLKCDCAVGTEPGNIVIQGEKLHFGLYIRLANMFEY